MKMAKLLNRKVRKLTVKDLKQRIRKMDDDSEVVLTFYMKDEGLYSVYLAEVLSMKYDGVLKESLSENMVCELAGFNHKYCTYVEDDRNVHD